MRVSEWLSDSPKASFDSWQAESRVKWGAELKEMDKEGVHRYRLMEKYGKIWRERVQKGEEL